MKLPHFLLLFTLGFVFQSSAQLEKMHKPFHSSVTYEMSGKAEVTVSTTHPYTAIVLEYDVNQPLQTLLLEVNNIIYPLFSDEHFEPVNDIGHSNLISLNQEKKEIRLLNKGYTGKITVHFLDGSHSIKLPEKQKNSNDMEGCKEPPSIDQGIWRQGLPEPNYSRIFTETKHLIVHHSAGSNTNTDYTQVVRDIYLYHTQVNGWSDIGYNYLIAKDGTLFKGRDPLNGQQDQVQGAHFCGKNSYTMGICLIGTYTSVSPDNRTLEKLIALSSWKCFKDTLIPTEYLTTNGIANLGVLAGHRDGCATECPGNNTYALLDSIKTEVFNRIKDCNTGVKLQAAFFGFPLNVNEGEYVSYVNTTSGDASQFIWNFEGGDPAISFSRNPAPVQYRNAGVFDVSLIAISEQGGSNDTLILRDYVMVNPFFTPRIYPNPIRRPYIFSLTNLTDGNKVRVTIYTSNGQIIQDYYDYQGTSELNLSTENSGLYLLKLTLNNNDSRLFKLVLL